MRIHIQRPRRSQMAIGALAISALTLAACGSGGGDESPGAGSDDGTTDATDTADPVTLEYLHRLPDGEGMVPVADIVDRWNQENPDVQVTSTKFDGAAQEMIVRLENDVNAGNAACVAQVGYSEAPELFVEGLLMDVSEYTEQYASNFSAGAYAAMQAGDAVLGLPQDVGPLVYYYNEAEFESLGIDVPTDLESFQEAAATAAAEGKYIGVFSPDEAVHWLAAQAAAAGDSWFTTEGDEWVVGITGGGSQVVADFWQTMIDDESVRVDQRWGEAFTQGLVNGEIIGHVGAAWEAGFFLDPLDGTEYEGQWRVAQLPDYGAGALTGPDGGSGLGVTTGCEHPAEAVEFINWFNTQADDLASQGLVIAASQQVTTPEKMSRQFGGQDVMAEMTTATDNLSADFSYAPGFSGLNGMAQTADGVAGGGATVADVFETGQSGAVEALTNLGLPVASE